MPSTFSSRPVATTSLPPQRYVLRLPAPEYRVPFVRVPGPPPRSRAIVRFRLPLATPLSARLIIQHDYQDATICYDFSYSIDGDAHVDVEFERPGPVMYYVTFSLSTGPPLAQNCSWLLIEPVLFNSAEKNDLQSLYIRPASTLDRICLISAVPKWLGPLNRWDPFFESLSGTGQNYNMVHFLPVQTTGISGSPYSIYHQLQLSPLLIGKPKSETDSTELQVEIRSRLQETIDKSVHGRGMLAMVDVVWNHTACNSAWLSEHPEATYCEATAPHLRPAIELDAALRTFSSDFAKYSLSNLFSDPALAETWLSDILAVFKTKIYEPLSLWEYFVLNKTELVEKFNGLPAQVNVILGENIDLVQYFCAMKGGKEQMLCDTVARARLVKKYAFSAAAFGSRYPKSIDVEWTRKLLDASLILGDNAEKEFEKIIDIINVDYYKEYDNISASIVENLRNTVRWHRIAEHGPRLGPVCTETPLVWPYFTYIAPGIAAANNGWIWNGDPRVDFASSESMAYLRRDVVVWGDCVKLRYGASRSESPFLWSHMEAYTREMARLFDAFRIDNCHSTPMHVARHLLRAARQERPNLYVLAELFTGDAKLDQSIVSQLGINSLIREAMQVNDAGEFNRLIWNYSNAPIGTLVQPPSHDGEEFLVLSECNPHALFMDCTHDNEPPAVRRTVQDTLTNTALVGMTGCASGSALGYDFCIPRNLDIVNEKRLYPRLEKGMGIHAFRSTINTLHQELSMNGMEEFFSQREGNFIVVSRANPLTYEGYMLIAHTAFKSNVEQSQKGALNAIEPIGVSRTVCQVYAAKRLEVADDDDYVPNDKEITGIPTKMRDISDQIIIHNTAVRSLVCISPDCVPGSVFYVKTRPVATGAIAELNRLCVGSAETSQNELNACLEPLSLTDFNYLLYRCEAEENGVYEVPGYGKLAYCGLEGVAFLLRKIAKSNDLSSPLCANLRAGFWMLDYIVARLGKNATCSTVCAWLKTKFDLIRQIPDYLVPKYFALVVLAVVKAARGVVLGRMGHFIRTTSLTKQLGLASVALLSNAPGASLCPTSEVPSLAAGLPHFSTNHMRCWGRDVFVSLRGLLLLTQQYGAARDHIMHFGSTMKHGLIPNLLDSGRFPRYNARDAVWWFFKAVQDYCTMAPRGETLLNEKVKRRFPQDDTWCEWDSATAYSYESSIIELIVESLGRHARGISFREHNAGPALDHAMESEGFNVVAEIDWNTGFVRGGNASNCGTWMDKMGDSKKAGNFGKPATPRDGSAIELVALQFSTLSWLAALRERGAIAHSGVADARGNHRTWCEWRDLVRANFEAKFFIPVSTTSDVAAVAAVGGIYRDTWGASRAGADEQLRPNQYVAMSVAPELFDAGNAQRALEVGAEVLLGPLGMRTLDPRDAKYRGDYFPENDSADASVAHGWNYHQGPEWVWVAGHFQRARVRMAGGGGGGTAEARAETCRRVRRWLGAAVEQVAVTATATSAWGGLTELTNSNGSVCEASSHTQAWSAATFLELEYELQSISSSI